jgi:protein TonB
VLLHVGFIYALYSGLLNRAVELVVPVVVMSQLIEPLQPTVPSLPPPSQPSEARKAVLKPLAETAPLLSAINDPTPAPSVPMASITPQSALASTTAPIQAAPAAPPSPPALQLPSSDADYLHNPKPAYPAVSRRLNEQGRTTIRVLIGTDGQPQRAEIGKSSGFSRLDDAALATVMRWRYVPGKRGGVAEAMWFSVPINWVLD